MKLQESFKLQENEIKEAAERLDRLFVEGEYKNDIKQKVYRGYDADIGTYGVYRIRKDRDPRDTDEFFDDLIFYLEEFSRSLAPKRSESKFATTFRSEASRYGNVYLCFPDTTANVVSLNTDAYSYFEEPTNVLKELGSIFYDIKENESLFSDQPVFRKFIVNVRDMIALGDPKATKKVAEFIWNERWKLLNLSDKYQEELRGEEARLIDSIDVAVNKIHGYFEVMDQGVKDQSDEIIFDGESYVMADEDWFSKHFEWTGSEWRYEEKI